MTPNSCTGGIAALYKVQINATTAAFMVVVELAHLSWFKAG